MFASYLGMTLNVRLSLFADDDKIAIFVYP